MASIRFERNACRTVPKSNGFTLIELLVVVSIIVLLLSLLAPAMDKAISIAETTACLGTLHSWGYAFNQYGFENDRRVPYYTNERGNHWPNVLAAYMGITRDPADQPGIPGTYDEPWDGLICSVVDVMPYNQYSDVDAGVFAVYGHAELTWAFVRGRGSYTINNWFAQLAGDGNRTNAAFAGYAVTKISQAMGQMPMLTDGMWVDHWPQSGDLPPTDFYHGRGDTSMGRVCLDRHRFGVNTARVDGSVSNVDLRDLWKQDWHKGFVKHEATADVHNAAPR